MKYGLLGYYPEYNHKDMETIDFSGEKTILEYDVLLVDLNNIFQSYESYGEYKCYPKITQHDSVKLKCDLYKRQNEIKEFLNSGKRLLF